MKASSSGLVIWLNMVDVGLVVGVDRCLAMLGGLGGSRVSEAPVTVSAGASAGGSFEASAPAALGQALRGCSVVGVCRVLRCRVVQV